MPKKKYVTKANFVELVKDEVRRNEMRELSISEDRDPELIKDWDEYVKVVSKVATTVKPKPVKKVKK